MPAWLPSLSIGRTRRLLRIGDSLTVGLSMSKELPAALSPLGWTFVGGVHGTDGAHEGHGGWTTTKALPNVPAWISAAKPTDVVIWLGTNDAFYPLEPIAKIAGRLEQIARIALSSGARVVLATIPPAPKAQSRVVEINMAIDGIVARLRNEGWPIVLADVDKAISLDELAADLVHLNAKGNRAAAKVLAGALEGEVVAPEDRSGGGLLELAVVLAILYAVARSLR